MTQIAEGSDCPNCGHPMNPHLLIHAEGEQGGFVMCPVEDCPCVAEWAPREGVTPEQIQSLFNDE